ncbi:LexA repressor [compost metagenome]
MVAPMGGKSYPDGTIIIVDPEVEPAPGKKVIARYGSDMTFKELVMDSGSWWLKPLNPQYPLLPVNEDVQICAVLVCSVMVE